MAHAIRGISSASPAKVTIAQDLSQADRKVCQIKEKVSFYFGMAMCFPFLVVPKVRTDCLQRAIQEKRYLAERLLARITSIHDVIIATSLSGKEKIQLIEALQRAGQDPNKSHRCDRWRLYHTALHDCARKGYIEVVQVLLEAKADPNKTDEIKRTPLHYCAIEGHVKGVEILLEAKADPNKQSKTGYTPLNFAVQKGHVEAAKILLRANDPNKQSKAGYTSLSLAAEEGDVKVIRLLLKAKTDPNIQDEKENTALHFAAEKGHVEAAKLLLRAKADPNKQSRGNWRKEGWTPLGCAAAKEHVEAMKLLLRAKADPNEQGSRHSKSLLYSTLIQSGRLDIILILLRAGTSGENRFFHDGHTLWLLNYSLAKGAPEKIVRELALHVNLKPYLDSQDQKIKAIIKKTLQEEYQKRLSFCLGSIKGGDAICRKLFGHTLFDKEILPIIFGHATKRLIHYGEERLTIQETLTRFFPEESQCVII